MHNRRYPLDLSAAMAVCDANYIRILKLFPRLAIDAVREFTLQGPGHCGGIHSIHHVTLRVTERFRYTSTVSIVMNPELASTYYRPPTMHVRLYHDACTAEVTSYQDQKKFVTWTPGDDYPEYSPDEKQQVNAFLAEWLRLCFEHGLGKRSAVQAGKIEQPPEVGAESLD